VALDLQVQDLGALAAALGVEAAGLSGSASVRGSLSVEAEGIAVVTSLPALRLEGAVQLSASEVAAPGVVRGGVLEAGGQVTIEGGRITLTGSEPWTLAGRAGAAGEVPLDLA